MRAFIIASSMLLLPTASLAGGLEDVVSYEGRLFLGMSDRVPSADAFLVGDGTMRLSFGRIGAELGMYGRADALDTPHETYGSLTYSFDNNGTLSVGLPRPAYDGFAVSALELAFPSLSIERTLQTRSAVTQGAMFAGWLPYGIAFENDNGTYRYGASVHHANGPNATVIGFGAATDVGDWKLSGAVESVNGSIGAKAQISRDFGPLSGGIGYYAPQSAGTSDLFEGFATLTPSDNIGLTTVIQIPTDGTAATAGFSARYSLNDTTGLAIGVATDAGSDAVYNAFIDFKF